MQGIYICYDKDHSGIISANELPEAFKAAGEWSPGFTLNAVLFLHFHTGISFFNKPFSLGIGLHLIKTLLQINFSSYFVCGAWLVTSILASETDFICNVCLFT